MQLVRDYDGFARMTQLLQWAALTFTDHDRLDGPPQLVAGHEALTKHPLKAATAVGAPPGQAPRELQVSFRNASV